MQRRGKWRSITIADEDKIAGDDSEKRAEVFGAEQWRHGIGDPRVPNDRLGCLYGSGHAGTAIDCGRKFVRIADNPCGTVGSTKACNQFPHAFL